MGKYEVLGWLVQRRASGDMQYYTYSEVHEAMRRGGLTGHYTSTWRSMNVLWSDGLLEASWEGTVVQRTIRFRAKLPTSLQVSDMKRLHNIPRKMEQKSCRAITRRPL